MDFINERKKQCRVKADMVVTMLFYFFILQNAKSSGLFSGTSIAQIQLLSGILKQHFIEFELWQV